MKTLTLLRHAKSSWKAANLEDFDRPLNKRGLADAPVMGNRFAARGQIPDRVITSPAARAQETTHLFCGAFSYPPDRILLERRIYGTPASILIPLLHDFDDDWQHVLLVGHNPALSELAHLLGGYQGEDLPTCTLLQLTFPIDHWWQVEEGCGTVTYRDSPKDE
jgi:phosphohistidine phosphatase